MTPLSLGTVPEGATVSGVAAEVSGDVADAVAAVVQPVRDGLAAWRAVGQVVARGASVAVTGEHRAADSPSLRVRGGIGGLAVELDALEAAAGALLGCARALGGVPAAVAAGRAAPALLVAAPLDARGAVEVEAALVRALGPTGAPAAAVRVAALGAHLGAVVLAYRGVDAATAAAWAGLRAAVAEGPLGLAGHVVWPCGGTPAPRPPRLPLPRGGVPVPPLPRPRHGDPGVPSGPWDAVAGLAGAALGGTGATPSDVAGRAASTARGLGLLDETDTVVVAAPSVPGAPAPPVRPASGSGELVARVGDLAPGGPAAPPGRVRVERVTRPGAPPVAVVYIPGTQTWSVADGPDPMDGGTDLLALAGARTAAQDEVTKALVLAGVGRDEPLLLVGHSQGGMTAAGLAADPAFRAEFSPVAVLTAGSPVARVDVPEDVVVLSLGHDDDAVTGADGAVAPDTATRITVTAPTPDGVGPHDISGYAQTGALVDATDDPSLVAWRQVVRPFCDGAGATSTSTDWVGRRAG